MIVSHEHRFIFMKTRKTAGTSLELALSQVCGPDDIISRISPEDEDLRRTRGRGAQNYTAPPLVTRAFPHSPARRVRRIVGHPTWAAYYKFSIERDPWDAVVSLYHWIHRDDPGSITFDEFVRSERVPALAASNHDIYRIDGRIAVDRVCRFESLHHDLGEVWSHLGLPGTPDLPRTKSGSRPGGADPASYYTPETAAIVAAAFRPALDSFGYAFEGSGRSGSPG